MSEIMCKDGDLQKGGRKNEFHQMYLDGRWVSLCTGETIWNEGAHMARLFCGQLGFERGNEASDVLNGGRQESNEDAVLVGVCGPDETSIFDCWKGADRQSMIDADNAECEAHTLNITCDGDLKRESFKCMGE